MFEFVAHEFDSYMSQHIEFRPLQIFASPTDQQSTIGRDILTYQDLMKRRTICLTVTSDSLHLKLTRLRNVVEDKFYDDYGEVRCAVDDFVAVA